MLQPGIKKTKFHLTILSNDSILYHAGRWCRREKKGWFNMKIIESNLKEMIAQALNNWACQLENDVIEFFN